MNLAWSKTGSLVGALLLMACSDADEEAGTTTDAATTADAAPVDAAFAAPADATPATGAAQTPPQGRAPLEAWLAAGHYRQWRCETAISPPRPNGAHTRTRVCSNAAMSAHGAGVYPVGAAAVKELYGGSGDTVTGYAVSAKVAAGATGAAWYWYERMGASVVADGTGVGLCAGCHGAAGTDAMHQGHDFVYVQVR